MLTSPGVTMVTMPVKPLAVIVPPVMREWFKAVGTAVACVIAAAG
jgi:hypothetical protein